MEPDQPIGKIDPNPRRDLPKSKETQIQMRRPGIKGNRDRCRIAIMFVLLCGTVSIAGFLSLRKMAPPGTDLEKCDKPIHKFLLATGKRNVTGECSNGNVALRASKLVFRNGRLCVVNVKKIWIDGIEVFDNDNVMPAETGKRSPIKDIEEFMNTLHFSNFIELSGIQKGTEIYIKMEDNPDKDGHLMISFGYFMSTSGNENESVSSGNAGTNYSDMESGNTQLGDLGGARQPDTESKDEVPNNVSGVPGNADVINIDVQDNPDRTEDQTSESDGFMVDAVYVQRVVGDMKVDKTSNVIIKSFQKIGR